jgi:hypothetical protein
MTNWTNEELAKIDLKGLLEYAIRSKLARTLSNTKSVCDKEGIPYDITVDDLRPFPLSCPVLGIPINWMSTGGSKNDSPSIDRVIPDKGYTKGNVRLISQKANRLKQNASLTELEAIVRYISEATGENHEEGR